MNTFGRRENVCLQPIPACCRPTTQQTQGLFAQFQVWREVGWFDKRFFAERRRCCMLREGALFYSTMADTVLKDGETTISCDQALRIARIGAESAYRDLSIYRIAISLDEDTWLVDYELKAPELRGGGPHHVIDAGTGEILSKRYEQ